MSDAPQSAPTIEARAALLLALRRAGVRDLAIMRAFETVPRENFAPFRFRDLAARNVALPLSCGQTLPAPADLARRIEALSLEPQCRVLEIGSGSGFSAAILAQLAREVVSVERFETLAVEAKTRLETLGVVNASAHFGDGAAPAPDLGAFDRIIAHVAFESWPAALIARLAPGGVIVFGLRTPVDSKGRRRATLVRATIDAQGLAHETDWGSTRLGPAIAGMAQVL
jgi:protein-L-isoaspartate(D-aspartate) O-methyltransferase